MDLNITVNQRVIMVKKGREKWKEELKDEEVEEKGIALT